MAQRDAVRCVRVGLTGVVLFWLAFPVKLILPSLVATILSGIGVVLTLVGLAYYARSKGRHPLWAAAVFIPIIGCPVLITLKDRTFKSPPAPRS